MSDLPLIAATEWARAHSGRSFDPIAFGKDVALVYCACEKTLFNAGDEKAMAAALASLSVPSEVWQSLAQLSSLLRRSTTEQQPTHSDSAES